MINEELRKKRAKWGREGGRAKVPKGWAMMDKVKLKKLASKGGKNNAKYASRNIQD